MHKGALKGYLRLIAERCLAAVIASEGIAEAWQSPGREYDLHERYVNLLSHTDNSETAAPLLTKPKTRGIITESRQTALMSVSAQKRR